MTENLMNDTPVADVEAVWPRVAVVIPSFKVTRHILKVISSIGSEVERIYVVDDCCPDGSGDIVEKENRDSRVVVLRNAVNQGVGGAVMHGYREALADGMDIVVKIDGDGQMDAKLLPRLIKPIVERKADYTKGNRFYDLDRIGSMPPVRIFGNAVVSFMAKFSTGYWGIFDPANGYTAIATPVVAHLPMEKISRRYFFETDILFRLNTLRAVVRDVPMHAIYGDETSHLRIGKILPEFLLKHGRNFAKRIFYNYFLRDMSVATLELMFGFMLLIFGIGFGTFHWLTAMWSGVPAPFGIIMFAALPILIGLQLLLAFLAYDIAGVPKQPIASELPDVVKEKN
jgi:glycosyltransferase involved in cell wall biosynthesis